MLGLTRSRTRGTRPLRVILLAAITTGIASGTALGFGTWDTALVPGYAEHERITRMGIHCAGAFSKNASSPLAQAKAICGQPRTTMMIAGANGYLGGVGAPDSFADAINSKSPQHCDDGDYLFGADRYPRAASARDSNLRACRALFDLYMDDAVRWAGEMVPVVDGKPTLRNSQADFSMVRCNENYDRKYDPGKGHSQATAKCNALISFGRAMHMAQDFFSHSNWIDVPLPGTPVGLVNPPGLSRTVTTVEQVPDFVRYPRSADQVNAFLASTQVVTGGYMGNLSGRVRHSTKKGESRGLNKDMGSGRINWTSGVIPKGKEERGTIVGIGNDDNFQRAAYAAATTTATAWGDLQQAVRAAYPGERGEMAVRALTSDAPWSACTMSGGANKALAPGQPQLDMRVLLSRATTIRIVNASGLTLECGSARLDWGEWSPLPPDAVPAGATSSFRTQNAVARVAGTQGEIEYRAQGQADSTVTIAWDNPLYLGNRNWCRASGALRCTVSGGGGTNAILTVTVHGRVDGQGTTYDSRTVAKPAAVRAAVTPTAPRPAARPIDVPMSPAQVRALQSHAPDIRECSGRAANVQLAVDDVSCAWAGRTLERLSEDLCPDGWRYRPGPKDAHVLCYEPRPGMVGDAAGRVMQYVIPHFAGGAHAHP